MTTLIIICGIGLFLLILFFTLTPKKGLKDVEEMIKKENFEKAKKYLQHHLKPEHFSPYAHFLLSKIYMATHQFDYALIELKSIIKHDRYLFNMSKKEIYNMVADAYLSSGKLDEAYQNYLILEKLNPHEYHIIYNLGKVLFHKKEYEKSIEYFNKALTMNSSDSDALAGLGMCYLKLEDLTKAQEYLNQALQFDKRNYEAHYYLALYYHNQNLYDKAVSEYEKAAFDKNLKVDSLFGLAEAYRIKEIYTKAIEFYEQSVNTIEQNADRIKHYEDKINYLSKALHLFTKYQLAECYAHDKNFAKAMEQWQEIDALDPDYKDVKQKIKENIRYGKDRIQDFIIVKVLEFEKITKYILNNLKYTIEKFERISNEEIMIEASGQFIDMFQGKTLILMKRNYNPIGERDVIDFFKNMNNKKIEHGLMISPMGISANAIKYALDKPIEFIGKNQMMRLLKQYEHRM